MQIMAVTPTSGAQAVTQSAWKSLQVEQAKQFAERAAMSARTLQARASAAQSEANRAQANAQSLSVKADQAQGVAVQANRDVRSSESYGQVGTEVMARVTQAAERPVTPVTVEATVATQPQTAPTVNTQGETIGTVIDVTA
jgi:hypothetical protein